MSCSMKLVLTNQKKYKRHHLAFAALQLHWVTNPGPTLWGDKDYQETTVVQQKQMSQLAYSLLNSNRVQFISKKN